MPLGRNRPAGPAPTLGAGGRRRLGGAGRVASGPVAPVDDTELPAEDEGISTPAMLAGGSILGAGAIAAASKLKNAPGILGKIGKGASALNAVRMQLMLSGLAVPKSIAGNIGASAIESMERGSIKPLKEMLSLKTLKDAGKAYKAFGKVGEQAHGSNIPYLPVPGRIMGAMDTASRNAFQRAGLTAEEAERTILQAPLQKDLAEALDSPLARYALPFRRTPFNQFIEGWKTLKPENLKKNPGVSALIAGAGATHGAMTSDEQYPLSVGIGSAAASRYGLPYALAALVGRKLAGGTGGESIVGSALPVSEYGLASSITDPTKPFHRPALRTLIGD